MSDEVTRENHWQITSRVTPPKKQKNKNKKTPKKIIHSNECIIYLHTILCPVLETH